MPTRRRKAEGRQPTSRQSEGAHWLATSAFWRSYYSDRLSPEHGEHDFEAVFDELFGPDARPVPKLTFRLQFPGEYCWLVEYGDRCSVHHLLHRDFDRPLYLGCDGGGNFELPILRFPEYRVLRAHLSAQERLLLAAVCWRTIQDDAEEVSAVLGGDWRRAQVLASKQIKKLVARVWFESSLSWRFDATVGWVTDGGYSVRNPDARTWRSPDDHLRFRHFLTVAHEQSDQPTDRAV